MITLKHRFLATVIIDGQILPNSWEMCLNMIPNHNERAQDISIVTDRVNVWIESMLDNSMLVGPKDMITLREMTSPFTIGVHPLPDEPYDRILAICLYTKISSIMEKKMFIDSIWLESYQSEGISHTYTSEDGDVELLRQLVEPGDEEFAEYWYRKDPVFFRVDIEGIQLKEQTWHDLGFGLGEKSDSKVVPFNKFKPRIIPGDKGDDIG
jgi:hypothetical protein